MGGFGVCCWCGFVCCWFCVFVGLVCFVGFVVWFLCCFGCVCVVFGVGVVVVGVGRVGVGVWVWLRVGGAVWSGGVVGVCFCFVCFGVFLGGFCFSGVVSCFSLLLSALLIG
ncbi:hypothetical protein, partial [Pseudomonas syringae group genomosp. 7]|uniref:hypothetical protein n=1 Tax=Pseudomonas syringae group genomosp. 7 TaxID=251699 RepID=UPI00376FB5AC